MRRVAHGATASRSLEVGKADLCVACAWTAAVGGPALPATVAAMNWAAKPKAGGLWPRERRAMVSAAVIAMRRCNSWLRSQQASAAHEAERAVGRRARIAEGASGVLAMRVGAVLLARVREGCKLVTRP